MCNSLLSKVLPNGAHQLMADAHLSPARRMSIPGFDAVASLLTSTGCVGGMAGRSTLKFVSCCCACSWVSVPRAMAVSAAISASVRWMAVKASSRLIFLKRTYSLGRT